MPTAPTYQRQVREEALPGAAQGAVGTPEAFGGGAGGEAIQRSLMGVSGDALDQIRVAKAKADDIAFIELDTQLANAETTRKVSLEKIKGKDALGASSSSVDGFGEDYRKIAESAQNDSVRQRLQRTYLLRRQSLNEHHQVYTSRETRNWTNQSITASSTEAFNSLEVDSSPKQVASVLAQVEQNAERLAVYNGDDSEAGKANARLDATSHVHSLVAAKMLREKNYQGAKQYYDMLKAAEKEGGKPLLTPKDNDDMSRAVSEGNTRNAALQKVADLRSKEISVKTAPVDYGAAPSGRKKGPGFLGPLPTKAGGVATEVSIGVALDPGDGNPVETEIPLLVPGLSKDQIDHLLAGNAPTREIIGIAVDHARARVQAGKSPFAGAEDMPSGKRKLSLDEAYAQLQADTSMDLETKNLASRLLEEDYNREDRIAKQAVDTIYTSARSRVIPGIDPQQTIDPDTWSRLDPEHQKSLVLMSKDPVNNDQAYGQFLSIPAEKLGVMSQADVERYIAQFDASTRREAYHRWAAAQEALRNPKALPQIQSLYSDDQMIIDALGQSPGTGIANGDMMGDIGRDPAKSKVFVDFKRKVNAAVMMTAANTPDGKVKDQDKMKIIGGLLSHRGVTGIGAFTKNIEKPIVLMSEDEIKKGFVPWESVEDADKAFLIKRAGELGNPLKQDKGAHQDIISRAMFAISAEMPQEYVDLILKGKQ